MQSNLIFGFLFAGFVIYIVTKNELPKYMGFFLGGTKSSGGVTVTATPYNATQASSGAAPWPSVTSIQ